MGALGRLGLGIAVLGTAACGVVPRVGLPVRTPDRSVADVESALERSGPEIRAELFADEAVLHVRDTVLTGPAGARYWTTGSGWTRFERVQYQTGRVYVCPDGAVQVGRYVAEERMPGATRPVPVAGRWLARWREADGDWTIVEAMVRPSLLETLPLAVDPACVAPSELSMGRYRNAVTVHWGGVWSHGGPAPGIEAQLRYAGLEDLEGRDETWVVGVGRRVVGSWGGRLLLAQRMAEQRTAGTDATGAVGLRSAIHVAALLAMHERWLFRVAAGPALAHVAWEWSGGETTPSSRWHFGWVNELAMAIPVSQRFFLDLSYHDWLVGDATPPEHLDLPAIDLRLRGSTLSLGVGRRF